VGGTLIIREALVEDSGKYLCMVNNSVGGESVETVLTVTGAYYHQLSGPGFRIRVTSMRIRIQLFSLQCESGSSFHSDPDPAFFHFNANPDPDPAFFTSMRIRIQLFSLQC
jgi:hypothetical protein